MSTTHTENRTSASGNSVREQAEPPLLDHPALQHLSSLVPIRELTPAWSLGRDDAFAEVPGQADVLDQIAAVMFRSRRRHPVLCGARGVGKSTVLLKLAQRILRNQVAFLSDHQMLYLDASNVGQEDSRAFLETLVSGLHERGKVLLLVDGVSALFRRPGGGSNKPLFRAMLSRPEIRLAASMVITEFHDHIASDALLIDQVSRIDIHEPDESELGKILSHTAMQLAAEYMVSIPDTVVAKTMTLCSTFLISEHEPARSVEVLRSACDDQKYLQTQRAQPARELEARDVVQVIAERTGISPDTIGGHNRDRDFLAALSVAVVGQPAAVSEVAMELELIAAGLNDPQKPATVLMFAGLTGVGKTELAKQIARLYSPSGRLKTYPMGNFTEPHSVSGLIGVPPGYVGHEEGGRLVNDLLADPYSVFLLDEAEKCHPNVWKPFLTLFDEGWILDQRGQKAYGDRAIFILTTNAGDRSIAQLQSSGQSNAEIADHVRKTLSRVRSERSSQPVFPPQFLSRIRRIVIFSSLSQDAMEGISSIFFQRMISKWKRARGKTIEVDTDVIRWIGNEACRLNELSNNEEGGRIAQKLISDKVEYEILKLAIENPDKYDKCSEISVSLNQSEGPTVEVHLIN